MSDDPIRILERRLERERNARKEAERLLEEYSKQLYQVNAELVSLNTQLESKIKTRTAEMMAARDKAIEGSRAKSEFLAVMSHEIRTPMNGVLGMLKLLIRSNLSPHQKRYTEVALASGESLLSIISDILDYSKLDAGKMQLEQFPFELQAFLEDTAALYSASAQKKDLKLVLSLEPPLPERVMGDPTRLRQVLSNLLNNAIKFTEKGHVALHVTCVGENLIHFSVVDSGIGMTDEQQNAIFEPFTQADSSHSRKYGGTGLGLSICRKIVEVMGGRLSVVSAPSLGSEFSFELNLPEVRDNVVVKAKGVVGFAGKRVLIADSYWANRVALRNMLKKLNISDIVAATDGAGACEELLRSAHEGAPYDVVLIDNQLPDMTGVSVASYVRSTPMLSGIITVLLLNMGEGEGTAEADFTLSKPVREMDLNECLTGTERSITTINTTCENPALDRQAVASVKNGRILLVDDNETNLLVAEELLAELPVQVDSVSNGLDAIEAVRNTRYSLILMDVQMPGIDGLETTRRIRLLDGGEANIPVIAMTAHTAADFSEVCQRVGMNGFLSKPLDPDVLIQVVNRHLHSVSSQVVMPDKQPCIPAVSAASSSAITGPSECSRPQVTDLQALEPPTSLPGIDLTQAMARVRGKWHVLRKILISFYNQQTSGKAAFDAALQAEDLKTLHMLAHTLKGSSATVGADVLPVIAGRIENAARESDLDSVRRDLPGLYDELNKVLDGLAGLESDTVVVAPVAESSAVTLHEQVDRLLSYLQTDIGEAQHLLETLKSATSNREIRAAFDAAEQHLNRFDMVATKAVLIDIRQKIAAAFKTDQ